MNKEVNKIKISEEEIEFLKESNAIERVYSDEALQDAKQSWMMAKVCGDEKISIDYILAIHRRLMKRLNPEIAGKLRDCRVFVGNRECMYYPEIRKALFKWCKKYKKPKTWKDIKQAHIDFRDIHPHQDGNGRTGRILMNIQRLNAGLPILIIHEGKEQQSYYKWFRDLD